MTNSTSTKFFETDSRKLEQFLYLHDIRHLSWRKNEDNMTVWKYENTQEVRRVVDEWREIVARRQQVN